MRPGYTLVIDDREFETPLYVASDALSRTHDQHIKALAESYDDLPALVKLAEKLEPALRRRFLAAIAQIRDTLDLERIAEAIAENSLTRTLAAAEIATFPEQFGELAMDLKPAFLAGAHYALAEMARSEVHGSFTLINPSAVEYARNATADLVSPFIDDAKTNIADIVARAMSGELTPKSAAREIQDSIGLDPRRQQALDNYQGVLEEDGLTGDLLDRKVGRYRQELLRSRADTIARTEIMRAANEGQRQVWEDMARRGAIDPNDWERVWVVTADDRLCDECGPLDDVRVAFADEFPEGEPPLHPHCRCTIRLEHPEPVAPVADAPEEDENA